MMKNITLEDQYDRYAPPVYGKILNIVQHVPIANSILEDVFVNVLVEAEPSSPELKSPLLTMIHYATDKSKKTIKALEIFRTCCSGASISIINKE